MFCLWIFHYNYFYLPHWNTCYDCVVNVFCTMIFPAACSSSLRYSPLSTVVSVLLAFSPAQALFKVCLSVSWLAKVSFLGAGVWSVKRNPFDRLLSLCTEKIDLMLWTSDCGSRPLRTNGPKAGRQAATTDTQGSTRDQIKTLATAAREEHRLAIRMRPRGGENLRANDSAIPLAKRFVPSVRKRLK